MSNESDAAPAKTDQTPLKSADSSQSSSNYQSTTQPDEPPKRENPPRKRLADTPLQTYPEKSAPVATTEVFRDIESALHAVGGFNRYQILFMLVVQWCITQFSGNYVILPLATYVPDVRCQLEHPVIHNRSLLPDASGGSYGAGGGTGGGKVSSVELGPDTQLEFCEPYEHQECANLTWDSKFFHTIIEEWSLICEESHVPELINSIQTLGNFFALLLVGVLSDHYGRKNVFCLCFMVLMIANPFSAAVHSWPLFAGLRCLVGAMVTAASTVLFVWSMESIDMEHNVLMNIASMWHSGYVIASLIGFATRAWRPFLVVVNIIGAPILFIVMSLVESPRWLIQTGRIEQAADALSFMARLNGRRIKITPESLDKIPRPALETQDETLNKKTEPKSKPAKLARQKSTSAEWGFMKLFENRQLAQRTALITFLNISISSTSAAYLFQVSLFSGDPIMKFLIFGLLRLLTVPVIYTLDKSFTSWGRRQMICVPFAFVFLFLLTASASRMGLLTMLPFRNDELEFYAMLTAAVLCNFLWMGTGQYTMEMFPTRLRNSAASFTTLFDPVGVIIVQQLVYLETAVWSPILFVAVASITFCALVLALSFLPETKGQPLPDAIEPLTTMEKEQIAAIDTKSEKMDTE